MLGADPLKDGEGFSVAIRGSKLLNQRVIDGTEGAEFMRKRITFKAIQVVAGVLREIRSSQLLHRGFVLIRHDAVQA